MRSFFAYIVENQRHIVPDFDPGDECIDQSGPEVGVRRVAIPERPEPCPDHLCGESGLFNFCPLNFQHEGLLLFLQGVQTRDKPTATAFLDRVQEVSLALPDGIQTPTQTFRRILGQLPLLDFHDAGGQLLDHVIGQHIVDRGADHQLLQVVLGERLQLAFLPTLFIPAFVIVIHFPGFTGAGLRVQHGPAVTAEAFTAQKVLHFCPPRRIVAARLKVFRRLLEGGLVDDRLHWQLDTLDLKLAQVLPVPQHSIYDIMRDRPTALANDPVAPEMLHQILHRGACNVHLERLTDQGGSFLVNDHMAVGVYFVAYRERLAAILPLLRRLPHAADDLLPEIGGVILGQALQHALQDDPLRAIRHTLLRIQQLDAGALQLQF